MTKKSTPSLEIEETPIISETKTTPAIEPEQEVNIEFNEPVETEKKLIETHRFIESEILYENLNASRPAWDLTDALIDLDTIHSVERILDYDRFTDFGCNEPEKHELHPENCCVIFSTAYPLGIILVENTYEDVIKHLIAYKG